MSEPLTTPGPASPFIGGSSQVRDIFAGWTAPEPADPAVEDRNRLVPRSRDRAAARRRRGGEARHGSADRKLPRGVRRPRGGDGHATGAGVSAPGRAGRDSRPAHARLPSARQLIPSALVLAVVAVSWLLLSAGGGDRGEERQGRAHAPERKAAGRPYARREPARAYAPGARSATTSTRPSPAPDPRASHRRRRPGRRSARSASRRVAPSAPGVDRVLPVPAQPPSKPAPPTRRAPALPAPVPPGSPPEFLGP